MLTRAQLLAEVGQINWHYEWFKTSSLNNLVAAVHTYAGNQNAVNLHNVYRRAHLIPAAKKLKYANALAALYRSMPTVYFRPNGVVNTTPGGIGVPRGNAHPSHQVDALAALEQLDNVAVGQGLITAIVNRIAVSGKRVGVQEWDMQATNKCHVVGANQDDAKADLALAVEFDQANVGVAITAALNTLGHNAAWLEQEIDATPIYDIVGVPSVVTSATTHGAGWVSQAMIQNWMNAATVFPAPLNGQQADDARVVLVSALFNGMTAQAGEHSIARWDPSAVAFTDTNNVAHARPAYIGLAHELIHAYHNISGDQAGHEIGTYSRVLYEYQCIGLGPWQNEPFTENSVRQSAGLAVRTCY